MVTNSLGTADLELCERLGEWALSHRGAGVSARMVQELSGIGEPSAQRRMLIDCIGLLWNEREEKACTTT